MNPCMHSGLSSAPKSVDRSDGLTLHGVRITNAVKCLPPENKPLPIEIKTCNQYLAAELVNLRSVTTILALGTVAHDAVLVAVGQKRSAAKFGHGNEHALPENRHMVDSYHCSRYNTQTRRLTPEMFRTVLTRAANACRNSGRDLREALERRPVSFDHKDFIANLPRRPGVYRMYSGKRSNCCTSARRAPCVTASATTSWPATSIPRCRRW